MGALNAEVQHVFKVVDLTGAPVSGLTSAAFALTLRRRASSSLSASVETVGVTSIGGGEYWVFYTPTVAATLYILTIEALSASHLVSAPAEGFQDVITADAPVTAGPYLTTLDRFKTAFGFKGIDSDPQINQLLPQITDYFQGADGCDRNFFSAEVTEYPSLQSSTPGVLFVRRPPITAVDSLHWSTAIPRVHDATTLLVEGTDFFVDETGQWIELVTRRSVCGVPNRVAKLVYTGGYASVPGDIERAVQEVMAVKIQKAKSGGLYHFANQSVQDGLQQGIRFDDLTPNAVAVITSRRLRSVA